MKAALVLMSRAPIAGKTKTRLQSHLKAEECAEIHRAFLKDISEKLIEIKREYKSHCSKLDLYLSYTPKGSEHFFSDLVSSSFMRIPQEGKDLGEKMYNSALSAYQQSQIPVIVTGSDLPSLPADIIIEAVSSLKEKDVVIGPSADGGYYLIGMQEPYQTLFNGDRWGSDNVLKITVKSALAAGKKIHFLPEWYDVDTFNELLMLREELLNYNSDNFFPKHSSKIINNIFS